MLRLTASGKFLYDMVRHLLRELSSVLDSPHYPPLREAMYTHAVQGMRDLFERFVLSMAACAKHDTRSAKVRLSEAQLVNITANAYFLSDDLLPRVMKDFSVHFGRSIPELLALQTKVLKIHQALHLEYLSKRARYWVTSVLGWKRGTTSSSGSNQTSSSASDSVSAVWLQLLRTLVATLNLVNSCIGKHLVVSTARSAMEEICSQMSEPCYWSGAPPTKAGIRQLSTDLAFLDSCLAEVSGQSSADSLQEVLDQAARTFTAATNEKVRSRDIKPDQDAAAKCKAEFMGDLEKLRDLAK